MEYIYFGFDETNILNRDYLKSIVKNCFIKQNFSRLGLVFHYDNDIREIYEIPEIIKFIDRLTKTYPNCFLYFNTETIKNILFVLGKGEFEFPNKIMIDFMKRVINMKNLNTNELELISKTILDIAKEGLTK